MKKLIWIVIIIILFIIGMASLLIWGFSTNWGKSFDGESVARYCYTACVKKDIEKYCVPNLIVHYNAANSPNYGAIAKDISCYNLAMQVEDRLVTPCQDIKCPDQYG